jgi:hypothetical protein
MITASIVNLILEHLRDVLQAALIDSIPADDPTRAGFVKIGPYQGTPAPDEGRITVSIHENDPDRIVKAGVSGMSDDWSDEMDLIEIGGAATTARRFSIKARCLFATTREDEDAARQIASAVRSRLETTLRKMSFASVRTEDEYVARGALSSEMSAEMMQAGGPPDAFDYIIKVHFSVLTTQTGIFS